MADQSSTTRFSDRVADYTKYRPDYPASVYQFLQQHYRLDKRSVIADIGAGTGIFCEPLLKRGCNVMAVEPNGPMREACDARLSCWSQYRSVAGTAENTTLADASVDLITAAQAFHWFDQTACRCEFARVLKPAGGTALVWNRRDDIGAPFQSDYESLLRERVPAYSDVSHKSLSDAEIAQWFDDDIEVRQFEHEQRFDFDSLCGRLRSSSYCPTPDTHAYTSLIDELRQIFERYAEGNEVRFIYATQVYAG